MYVRRCGMILLFCGSSGENGVLHNTYIIGMHAVMCWFYNLTFYYSPYTTLRYSLAIYRYFLPEDGDVEDTPNVFLAPKSNRPGYPPQLGQIKKSFPLPGTYHFRFKTALVPGTDRDKNAVPVWMDCVGDSECVPVWQSSIIAKVTRISLEEEEYDEDFDRTAATHSRANSNVSTSSSVHSASQQQKTTTSSTQSMHSSDSLLGAFDDTPVVAPSTSAASSVHSSADNLLNDHHPAPPASGGSLLDMDHHTTSGANTPTEHHNDLLNMSAPAHNNNSHQTQPPMQQQHQQKAPMQGQYPGQYPSQQQQGMAQMPAPQQQQHNQQNGNKLSMGGSLDPLGNLGWNM